MALSFFYALTMSSWSILITSVCIMGVLEEKDKDQGIEKNLSEKIMIENFPNLVKEIDIQVQEAQRVPNKLDPKRITPTHIIIKMQRLKINRES